MREFIDNMLLLIVVGACMLWGFLSVFAFILLPLRLGVHLD